MLCHLSPSCEAEALTGQLIYRSEVSVRQTRATVNGRLQLSVSCCLHFKQKISKQIL